MIDKKYITATSLVVIIGIAIAWWVGVIDYITFEELKLYRMQLQNFVQNHYLVSVLAYITIFVAAVVFFIPITVVLTIAGGFLFGVFIGALYANVAATLGSTILFLIVRYLFGEWFQQRYKKQLVIFNRLVQENGASYLLFLQLLPITPFFLINILAGMSQVPLSSFIWATSVGILPGTLVYTFAGQKLSTIERVSDIVSYGILFFLILLALLSLLPIMIKRYKNTSAL